MLLYVNILHIKQGTCAFLVQESGHGGVFNHSFSHGLMIPMYQQSLTQQLDKLC